MLKITHFMETFHNEGRTDRYACMGRGYSDRSAWRSDAWNVADAVEWLYTGRLLHNSIVVAGSR